LGYNQNSLGVKLLGLWIVWAVTKGLCSTFYCFIADRATLHEDLLRGKLRKAPTHSCISVFRRRAS